MVLQFAAVTLRLAGTEGAVVSPHAGVLATAGAVWADWLPALSIAVTA